MSHTRMTTLALYFWSNLPLFVFEIDIMSALYLGYHLEYFDGIW